MTAEERVAELEHRLGMVEDELAIRRLQHAYGYYLDKCYYDEVVDLFDEDCEVIFIGGVYKGRAGAGRLYTGRFRSRFADGHNGPQFGRLLEHPMLQDLISVAPDRRTAYARYRTLMQAGTHELVATPETPVRQGMEAGWAHTPVDYVPNASATYPEDPYGPDELLQNAPRLWPETTTLPFHYKHPVTGKEFVPDTWGSFPEA